MTIELAPEIEENYRALKAERGHSWAELAAEIGKNPDDGSQTVAAWCREQGEDEAPARRSRTKKDKSVTPASPELEETETDRTEVEDE